MTKHKQFSDKLDSLLHAQFSTPTVLSLPHKMALKMRGNNYNAAHCTNYAIHYKMYQIDQQPSIFHSGLGIYTYKVYYFWTIDSTIKKEVIYE